MKIIFLDIDGVLATRRAWSNRPENWTRAEPGEFHKPVKEMFEEWLIAHPEVQIVLSSTWRMTKNPIERPFGWKFRIRKESPIICDRIISVTPRHNDSYRGREITEWLEAHPEVNHWCIIDDDIFDQDDMEHFVHTKTSIGLTRKHLEFVERILDV